MSQINPPKGSSVTRRIHQIADRLAQTRKAAGIKFANDAAAQLGCSVSIYSCYERGERLDVVARWIELLEDHIAKLYGTSSLYLLGLIDDPKPTEAIVTQLKLGSSLLAVNAIDFSETFSLPLANPIHGHQPGEVLFFTPCSAFEQGGLYAIDDAAGGIIPSLIWPISQGGWILSDGTTDQIIEAADTQTVRILGKYRCKLTDL